LALITHINRQKNYDFLLKDLIDRKPTLANIVSYAMQTFQSFVPNVTIDQKEFQSTFIDIANDPNRLKKYSISLCLYAEFIKAVIIRKKLLNSAVIIANHYIHSSSSQGCVEKCCDFGIPSDEFKKGMTHEDYLKKKILVDEDPTFIRKMQLCWNPTPHKGIRGDYRIKVFEICQDHDYDYAISVVFGSSEKTIEFSDQYLRDQELLDIIEKRSSLFNSDDDFSRLYSSLKEQERTDNKLFISLINDIKKLPSYSYNQSELDNTIYYISKLLPLLYKNIPAIYQCHTQPEIPKSAYTISLGNRVPTTPARTRYTRNAFPEFAKVLDGTWKKPNEQSASQKITSHNKPNHQISSPKKSLNRGAKYKPSHTSRDLSKLQPIWFWLIFAINIFSFVFMVDIGLFTIAFGVKVAIKCIVIALDIFNLITFWILSDSDYKGRWTIVWLVLMYVTVLIGFVE